MMNYPNFNVRLTNFPVKDWNRLPIARQLTQIKHTVSCAIIYFSIESCLQRHQQVPKADGNLLLQKSFVNKRIHSQKCKQNK